MERLLEIIKSVLQGLLVQPYQFVDDPQLLAQSWRLSRWRKRFPSPSLACGKKAKQFKKFNIAYHSKYYIQFDCSIIFVYSAYIEVFALGLRPLCMCIEIILTSYSLSALFILSNGSVKRGDRH